MRWWRALQSPRGRFWSRVVLLLIGLGLAVAYLTDGRKPVYGWIWLAFAAVQGAMAWSAWRKLAAEPADPVS